jgi:hypothetical protein
MENISPAELYAFELNNNDPKYYAQIPAVIFQCTYLAPEPRKDNKNYGKMVRKRLSVYAITLYTYIKQLAGRSGKVWMTTDSLAEECNMSQGSISNAKKELLQPLEQLNGKSLIEIKTASKSFTREDGSKGAKEYHIITPTHIWPENNAYMATIKYHQDLKIGLIEPENIQASDSRGELDQASASRRELDSLGSDSRREAIQKNSETEASVFNKTEATASPPACSLNQEEISVFSAKEETVKKILRKEGAVLYCPR